MLLLDLDYDAEQWGELLAAADMPVYEGLYEDYPYDQLAPCPDTSLPYGPDRVLELMHDPDHDAELLADIAERHAETVELLAEKLTIVEEVTPTELADLVQPAPVVDAALTQEVPALLGLAEAEVPA